MTQLRLTIEPIPARSRLASLANLLPRDQWNPLRRSIYRQARYRCQACGREGRLHCHEMWGYNDQTSVQWLRGFAALCDDCHAAKHLLFVHDAALRDRLLGHLTSLNQMTRADATAYLHAAARRQQWLNQRSWVIDYGEYNLQMPCLADTDQRRAFLKQPTRNHDDPISLDWL
jgi:hypothetical protein